jgi:diguanylate cyclase (GGDEF)-like protein
MIRLFNKRVLYIIPIIFFIVIIVRITYAYNDIQNRKYSFALNEAEVLSNYALTHREYYQKLFINKTIKIDEKTLPALPAYSSHYISNKFSQKNKLNITLKTVSDKARNLNNQADKDELKAINFFKNNPKEKLYFSDDNDQFYQFAQVLRIEQKCLKCHGKKEKAPLFIQKKYDKSYNYKLGEVRGVESIRIPKSTVNSYFLPNFINSVIYDLVLFIALFFAIFLLIKKSKTINHYLETEVKSKTKELKNMLVIDRLTDLPNRLQLLEDIQKNRSKKSTHLALINVDRFKDINDFYGHSAGDIVLQQISNTIKTICVDKNSFIYKLPSDEFAVFTTRDLKQTDFIALVKNLTNVIQQNPIKVDENFISISLSTGIASNEELLLQSADMALQSSKNQNNELIVYSKGVDNTKDIQKNIEGIALIKDAISRDAIVPYFQPIFNVHTQKIEKYESLVRIIQKDGDVLSPFKFLDIAIKSKLYPNITRAMIKKSFEFFRDKDYEFSINLSIDDIVNTKTKLFIIKELESFIAPQRVTFEILESDKIEAYEEIKTFIKDLKHFNCKFAIDDFGSGYSNFAHILELNIDYLKIDASLVKYITTDENSRVITKTIVNFASTLGLKTIAEFVEDIESLEMLQKMGVDYVQGYHIGKPDVGLNTTYQKI